MCPGVCICMKAQGWHWWLLIFLPAILCVRACHLYQEFTYLSNLGSQLVAGLPCLCILRTGNKGKCLGSPNTFMVPETWNLIIKLLQQMSYPLKTFFMSQRTHLKSPNCGRVSHVPMTKSFLQLHFFFVTDPLTKMMFWVTQLYHYPCHILMMSKHCVSLATVSVIKTQLS